MALELPFAYHTETMVKILRNQGSSVLAMELAEKILWEQPEKASVRILLQEMKEEAKASFERFRQAGMVKQKEILKEENVILLQPKFQGTLANSPGHSEKLKRLQGLLRRVQKYRHT